MKTPRLVWVLILETGLAAGSGPIASVCSTGRMVISGVETKPGGVVCWPVFDGDGVKTTNASAFFLFRDGTRLVLGKSSRVEIDQKGGKSVVRVLEGLCAYSIVKGSRVEITAPGMAVESSGRGSIVVSEGHPVLNRAGNPPALDLDGIELMRRLPFSLGPAQPSDLR